MANSIGLNQCTDVFDHIVEFVVGSFPFNKDSSNLALVNKKIYSFIFNARCENLLSFTENQTKMISDNIEDLTTNYSCIFFCSNISVIKQILLNKAVIFMFFGYGDKDTAQIFQKQLEESGFIDLAKALCLLEYKNDVDLMKYPFEPYFFSKFFESADFDQILSLLKMCNRSGHCILTKRNFAFINFYIFVAMHDKRITELSQLILLVKQYNKNSELIVKVIDKAKYYGIIGYDFSDPYVSCQIDELNKAGFSFEVCESYNYFQ